MLKNITVHIRIEGYSEPSEEQLKTLEIVLKDALKTFSDLQDSEGNHYDIKKSKVDVVDLT